MPLGDLINKRLGSWQLIELLGAGGAAEVYRARHTGDGSACAVKVLRAEHAADKVQKQALTREHGLLAKLEHPSIPRARRLEQLDGRLAMTMDLVEGRPLHLLAQEGRRYDRIGVLLALCGIVAYLHDQGLVHNDLKPENLILAPDGKLRLLDFGNAQGAAIGLLARLLARSKLTVGTTSYLAPELITGGRPSPASDCYAIGICAHHLLAGSVPFARGVRQTLRLHRTVTEDIPPIAKRVPALPPRLAKVIDGCLVKDPSLRPQHAAELRSQLRACFGQDLAGEIAALNARLASG